MIISISDIIMLGMTFSGLLLIVIIQLVPKSNSKKNTNKLRQAPFQFTRLRISWLRSQLVFQIVDYYLVALSFISMVIIIYTSNEPNANGMRIIFYAILSFVFSVINIIFKPQKIASGYRKAFKELNNAIMEYEYTNRYIEDIKNQTYGKLVDAVLKGEMIIAQYNDLDFDVVIHSDSEDIEDTK